MSGTMGQITGTSRKFALTGFLASSLVLLVATNQALAAKPAKKSTEPHHQCRGIDMMHELAVKEPETHTQILADAAKVENAGAILWKIEKPGVPASHLLGTMHVSDTRITTLSPTTLAVLDKSKIVMLEVADLSQQATMAAIGRAANLLMFSDGRRLDKMLSPEDYATVKATVQKAGLPGEFAAAFRPWIVSTLLAVSECERKNAASGHAVLDSKIGQEAKARKIPVAGLETVESQLASMAAVSDDEQVQMLKAALKFAHRSDDMLETLTQMYMKRQMGAAMPFNLALAAKAGVKPEAFSGFQSELLHKRNHKMREGARRHIDNGGALIAVGALHLQGPTGLVKLFRDAGYTVTPVE
ncbi:MAG: polysaccharide biosynthesis protein GumN [Hyphomicrobium sp.]|nr:polysaccharide biosynthesis protein GumN [Hyphomicrobium sp.]PPC82374.1 MAG: polysaccharide biosynthesis protein GumN [Hyphomicrobium sp.]